MRIVKCEQKSPEWFEARRGVPTSSTFDKIMTPKEMKLSASAIKLAYELVGQLHYPGPLEELERFQSAYMKQGNELEAEARAAYAMVRDVDVVPVGFIVDDLNRFGCSPDGLIGEDGGLELKCVAHATQVEYLANGVLPFDYLPQVHGTLLITGRPWWDFMSYARGLPPFIVRVMPTEATQKLSNCLDLFWVRFVEVREKIAKLKGAGS